MKKFQIYSIITVFILTLVNMDLYSNWPCEKGSGNFITETRDIKGFNKVILEGSGKIFITQGSSDAVKIETDDNIMPLLLTTQKSSTLNIGSKSSICPKKLNIYLTMKDIRALAIDGSGDIITNGNIETKDLIIDISGSGNILINQVKSKKLAINLSGSGDIKISGNVNEFMSEINGSGDINNSELETNTTFIEINGSGDAEVWANEKLMVKINGSGDVIYKGNPKIFKEIYGSGKVKAKK